MHKLCGCLIFGYVDICCQTPPEKLYEFRQLVNLPDEDMDIPFLVLPQTATSSGVFIAVIVKNVRSDQSITHILREFKAKPMLRFNTSCVPSSYFGWLATQECVLFPHTPQAVFISHRLISSSERTELSSTTPSAWACWTVSARPCPVSGPLHHRPVVGGCGGRGERPALIASWPADGGTCLCRSLPAL